MIKLKAAELRLSQVSEDEKKNLVRNPIYIIADNVLDTYNIGSIFRLADAVSATKVYLCGGSETPPHTRIKKASINTTEWVTWSYTPTAVDAIQEIKNENPKVKIVSVEQSDNSVPYDTIDYSFPIAIIVGHETTGITKEAMDASDYVVDLPMWGVNTSLNVVVSLGIVLYEAVRKLK